MTAHTAIVPDAALVVDRAWINREIAEIAVCYAAFSRFIPVNGIVPLHVNHVVRWGDARAALYSLVANMSLPNLFSKP